MNKENEELESSQDMNRMIKMDLDIINEKICLADDYEVPAWKGIADLIEESDFGKKKAEIKVEIREQLSKDKLSQEALSMFIDLQLTTFEICLSILGEYGKVDILPFSEGIYEGRKCMTLSFVPR